MPSVATVDLIPRSLAPVVRDAMSSARIVAVLGPRQSGKSTLATAVGAVELGGDHLTLDDEATREAAKADPDGLVASLGRTTVIDEIQRAPGLLLAIKARVDRDPTPGQFLLTGSANLRRLPTVADALPGRVDYLTLWPFAQSELGAGGPSLVDRLMRGEPPEIRDAPVGLDSYADRLLAGGFPEGRRRSGASRARFFRSYLDGVVDRDLADAGSLRRPEAAASLLRLIAARTGSLAQYQRLGTELGLDGKTAKGYAEALERLFLIRVRRAWTTNLGKRQVRSPKLYIADTGLLSSLIGIDRDRLRTDRGLAGALVETFVANELERSESWADDPATLWHFREQEHEVDVVAERAGGHIVGIEVKASATVRPADVRGLERLRDQTGARFRGGVVLYTGAATLPFGDRLWAVPLCGLWTE